MYVICFDRIHPITLFCLLPASLPTSPHVRLYVSFSCDLRSWLVLLLWALTSSYTTEVSSSLSSGIVFSRVPFSSLGSFLVTVISELFKAFF